MPANVGWRASTNSTNPSVEWRSTHNGTASTPPRYLNSSALPSITGSAAAGPTSPRPSTREPSDTMATVLARFVCSSTSAGSAAIARLTAATPGVYQTAKSSRLRTGHFGNVWILPR